MTAIYIPTADDEALRDLVRAQEDAVGLSTQTSTWKQPLARILFVEQFILSRVEKAPSLLEEYL